MKYFLIKFKGALITALVFMLLLGFIFFRDTENKKVTITESSYDFQIDGEVSAVEIYYPKSWVLLERVDEGWVLVEDEEKFRANGRLVDKLIKDIKEMDIIGTVPVDEVDLDQFGLETAKAEIVLSAEDRDHRFIIGDKIPVGSGTYVYVPDENLVLVVARDYLKNYLDTSASSGDFRDKSLFDFDSNAVSRISIRAGNFRADMFKEKGEWYLEEDDQMFIDTKKIDELLWIFSRAKVLDFEDENPEELKKYGLDEPTAEIRFYEDDRIQGLIFGKRKDEDSYYIKTDSGDAVYTIHKSLFKRIPKNIEEISAN
jgi:hypothetical protein